MGLERLHPMWKYKIFREISKETDWERFRKRCRFFEPVYDWCSIYNSFCTYEDCPLIKKKPNNLEDQRSLK